MKTELSAQLEASKRRIAQLELEAEQQALTITKAQSQQSSFRTEFSSNMNTTQQHVQSLRDELKELSTHIQHLSGRFREIIKQEHLKALSTKVDQWPLESYMTKEEFSELLKQRL